MNPFPVPGSKLQFADYKSRVAWLPFSGLYLLFLVLLAACAPTTPAATNTPVHIQYSFAARPWLAKAQGCAGDEALAADMVAADLQDVQAADLTLRIGLPAELAGAAYQVGTEDLLVIVNRQNPLQALSAAQVGGLFGGRIINWKSINGQDAAVQVWIFSSGEDVQQIFDQTIPDGSPATSNARLANSPEEMLQAVGGQAGAIGLIPRGQLTANVAAVFTAAPGLPVLAIPRSNPPGSLLVYLACLQKQN